MPALAIFADTQWEPRAVYEWLDHLETLLPFPVVRVTAGHIRDEQVTARMRGKRGEDGARWASLPYYTSAGDGSREGMTRRQCTAEYKIQPIERYLRRHVLGLAPRQRAPRDVRIIQWRGISTDEASRMKPSQHAWMQVRYPLAMELRWSRQDCIAWLSRHVDRPVPRSACIGCPFHSDAEWRDMRDNRPDEWADAVDFDARIRRAGGMRGDTYLHRQCVPLPLVDLDTPEQRGQLGLWGEECEGMCGL